MGDSCAKEKPPVSSYEKIKNQGLWRQQKGHRKRKIN